MTTAAHRNHAVMLFTALATFAITQTAPAQITVRAKVAPDSAWRSYSTRTISELAGYDTSAVDGARSVYGGQLARRVTATGFFRTEKIDGRWWLVDPQGYLYLNAGLVSVTPGSSAPTPSSTLPSVYGTKAVWADSTSRMLKSRGFNGTGAWSDDALLQAAPVRLPYTKLHNFMSEYGKIRGGTYVRPGNTGYPDDLIFVFDPEFEMFCDTRAAALTTYKNDPYLIGYFSDNEMPTPRDALNRYLALTQTDPGYIAARAWFTARKGATATIADINRADQDEFLRYFAETYYGIVNRAIKKYDPNHLYLGSRINFLELPYHFYQGAGPHLDIVSVNYYNTWTPVPRILGLISANTGKPLLITEWYVKGDDLGFPNTTGAGWIVPTQRDRGLFYQHFALALLESKFCVGWQWFKYMDNDTLDTNAELSNRDANKGIVTTTFMPHSALIDLMASMNARLYSLAAYFDSRTAVSPLTVRQNAPQTEVLSAHPMVRLVGSNVSTINSSVFFRPDGRTGANVKGTATHAAGYFLEVYR